MQVLGGWALPLPTIDPQIVRRSAAALDRYGPDFRYGHFLQLKKLGTVLQMTGGVAAIAAAAQFKPTRERLLKIRGSGDGLKISQPGFPIFFSPCNLCRCIPVHAPRDIEIGRANV